MDPADADPEHWFLLPIAMKKAAVLSSRVVDPYSFFPDPDPEFEAGDQSGSNPDPGL